MSDPTLPDREDAVPPAAGQAPSSGAIPRGVTRDRVGACLTINDYRFTIDNDGDLSSLLDGNPLWFLLMGETGGVTDAQLIQHLSCAIATAGLAFKAIGEAFGHPEES